MLAQKDKLQKHEKCNGSHSQVNSIEKNTSQPNWTKENNCTSRPARVSKTVPRPPAVIHFWVEKPNNSMNNETAATQTAVYTALPANWKPICKKQRKNKTNILWYMHIIRAD